MRKILRVVGNAIASDLDCWSGDGAEVQRLRKGMNNALYRVEMDGRVYACKLCVPDERRRADREYNVLRWLQGAGLDIAPQPLGLERAARSCPIRR